MKALVRHSSEVVKILLILITAFTKMFRSRYQKLYAELYSTGQNGTGNANEWQRPRWFSSRSFYHFKAKRKWLVMGKCQVYAFTVKSLESCRFFFSNPAAFCFPCLLFSHLVPFRFFFRTSARCFECDHLCVRRSRSRSPRRSRYSRSRSRSPRRYGSR